MKFELIPKNIIEKISSDLVTDCVIVSIYSAAENEPSIAANEHIKNALFINCDNTIDKIQSELINRFVNEYVNLPLCIITYDDDSYLFCDSVAAALRYIHNGSRELSNRKINTNIYYNMLNSYYNPTRKFD